MGVKGKVFKILEVDAEDRGFERAVNLFLLGLIVLSVASVILETVEDIYRRFSFGFEVLEVLSVAIFTVEYLLRVWTCTVVPRFAHPFKGRIRFILSPMALVDLVAILPSLIPGGTLDLRFVRAIRLLRLSRVLKIARYSQSLQTLRNVLRAKREELGVTAFAGLLLLACAACGMYFAEHDAQPKTFSSIPATAWWGVVTLTTVGYGDMYPVTPLGKALASVIAVLGIGLFALPAGILAGGFADEVRRKRTMPTCPHCGREIE